MLPYLWMKVFNLEEGYGNMGEEVPNTYEHATWSMRIGHSLTWYWFRPNFMLVLQGTNMAQVRLQLCSRSHPPCSCSWCSKMRSEIEHSCSPVTTPFKLGVSFMLPILNMNEIGYGRGKHVHTQDERICSLSGLIFFHHMFPIPTISCH